MAITFPIRVFDGRLQPVVERLRADGKHWTQRLIVEGADAFRVRIVRSRWVGAVGLVYPPPEKRPYTMEEVFEDYTEETDPVLNPVIVQRGLVGRSVWRLRRALCWRVRGDRWNVQFCLWTGPYLWLYHRTEAGVVRRLKIGRRYGWLSFQREVRGRTTGA